MVIKLISRGLDRDNEGKKTEPNYAVENSRFFNRMDEAFGMLCLSNSRYHLFNVDSITNKNEFYLNIESLFMIIDELRGHQLEKKLIFLIPSQFEMIQDFFTKFKSLVLQLKKYGIEKKQ